MKLFLLRQNQHFVILTSPDAYFLLSKSYPVFVFGPHQRWCELLHKNVLSCVVHTISGVIHDP